MTSPNNIAINDFYTKIGFSANIKKRVSGIQTGNPSKVTLYGSIETSYYKWVELFIHKQCARYRIHGEWFDISTDQIDFIIDTITTTRIAESCFRPTNFTIDLENLTYEGISYELDESESAESDETLEESEDTFDESEDTFDESELINVKLPSKIVSKCVEKVINNTLPDLTCKKCNKTFGDSYKKKRHDERIIPCDIKFVCEKCDETFPTNANLKRHMARKKPCDANPVADNVNNKCEHCGNSFSTKSSLIRHYKTCKREISMEMKFMQLSDRLAFVEQRLRDIESKN